MLNHLTQYQIILGSQSPRRKELLQGLNLPFEVRSIDVEENYPDSLKGAEIPCFLAEKKANAYTLKPDELLITADTIVWQNDKIFGKPTDKEDARTMLESLSGRNHEVITGVCIRTQQKSKVFFTVSQVRFACLTSNEIEYYLENYRPYDKAGAYGVQEWIGYIGVEHIEGSYYNIMGLPIQRLYNELKNW